MMLINSSAIPIDDFETCSMAVSYPSRLAPSDTCCTVLGRWPTEVNIWPREHELHRPLCDPRGQRRERGVRPHTQSCAERTADERRQYPHAGGINAERGRERIADGMGILGGVVDRECIAVPYRDRGKQTDRAVRVDGGGIDR
jgi:hypothetical protein